MTTTHETVPNEQKFYNPMIVKLETLEVKGKTVENYIKQIKSNFYCSVKAHYLIARDLFDAKQNLKNEDYSRLVEALKFSDSTQSKYLKIGSDVRLWKLFIEGKLPMKWTNQYLLTKLTDEQFKKVQKVIDPETSAKDIVDVAEFKSEQKSQIENDLLSFLQLEIDKTTVSVSAYEDIVAQVKCSLTKIPQIKINDEKVEKVKDRISSFAKQIEKAKNILAA
jgi:hypothetical protein